MAGAGAFLWLLAGRGSKSNGLKLLGFRVKATAHGSCWVAPMLEGALGGISWWAEG